VKKIVCFLLLYFAIGSSLFSQTGANRELVLYGLKIFKDEDLIKRLSLNRFLNDRDAYAKIDLVIKNFYHSQGYTLAVTYLAKDTSDELGIYIDEGTIGNVVFKGLDDITLIRTKLMFSLPKRVYHKPTLEKELIDIKKKFKIYSFDIKLNEIPDYGNSFIQLGDIRKLPVIPDSIDFPFFERYGYRYDLQLTAVDDPSSPSSDRKGFTLSASLFYIGIKPKVKYTYPNLFYQGDIGSAYLTGGISYFQNFNAKKPPSVGFIETGTSYNFAPIANFFSPGASAVFHFAYGSRPDIGITKYEYLTDRLVLEPSITILSSLKLYPGAGIEKFHLLKSSYDETYNASEIQAETHLYTFVYLKTEVDRFIFFMHPAYQRSATLTYSYYENGNGSFRKLEFLSNYDFSAYSLDIFSLSFSGTVLTGNSPFYHDESVSGAPFRGFTGKGYYSKKILKAEAEYRTSIHLGYLFVGPFADGVIFKSVNKDLPASTMGFCGGIAGHFIFFDQFELNAYFGKDYLFFRGYSAYNLSFSLIKHY
jgi:hypothetical protein